MKKKKLMEQLAALRSEETSQLERLEKEGAGLKGEELAAYKTRESAIKEIEDEIAGLDRLAAELQKKEDLAAANDPKPTGAATVHNRAEDKPWRGVGEFLSAVIRSETSKGRDTDPRLQALASGQSEGVASEGGFLVGTDVSKTLMEKVHEEGQLAARCATQVISNTSNSLKVPGIVETSRADGGNRYGGLNTYWQGEAAAATKSTTEVEMIKLELKKLTGLGYVTEELQADAPAMESYLDRTFPKAMAFALDAAIYEGDGVLKPLGFTKNTELIVTVAKESGQAADTIVAANITKMFARLPAWLTRGAAWFCNQDVFPQLPLMTIGQMPVFLPPGGLTGSQYGTMLGLPVIPIEHCATIGDLNDLVLANMSQYLLATKGGIQQSTSIHVKFLEGETALRFMMRVDGQPMWKTALTPKKGTNKLSPFVNLEAR